MQPWGRPRLPAPSDPETVSRELCGAPKGHTWVHAGPRVHQKGRLRTDPVVPRQEARAPRDLSVLVWTHVWALGGAAELAGDRFRGRRARGRRGDPMVTREKFLKKSILG